MASNKKSLIQETQSYLLKGNIGAALDHLLAVFSNQDAFFHNEVLLLKQRFSLLESEYNKGVLPFEKYQIERNKVSSAIVYILQQLPDEREDQHSQKRNRKKGGKLLHDIPKQMPVGLETKCVVRIAENEEILMEDYTVNENTQLEDIPFSKIMEVELIDFGDEKSFNIRTFNSSEQSIEQGDYTQWLFFIKPLKEGQHTLFLKVSIIQVVEGRERKKEVVLERRVSVSTTIPEPVIDTQSSIWQDTNIYIGEEKTSKKAIGAAMAAAPMAKASPAKGVSSAGHFAILKKATAALVIIGVGGVIFLQQKDQSFDIPSPPPAIDTVLSIDKTRPIEPVEKSLPSSYEATQEVIEEVIEEDREKEDEAKESLKEKAPKQEAPKPKSISPNQKQPELTEPDVVEKIQQPKQEETIEDLAKKAKKSAYILAGEVQEKEEVEIGGNIYIKVTITGFKRGETKYYINNKYPIRPTDIDGNDAYFKLKATKKELSLTVHDLDSDNRISQSFAGNKNADWQIRRKVQGSIQQK